MAMLHSSLAEVLVALLGTMLGASCNTVPRHSYMRSHGFALVW
jgi:hypothetical protein